MSTSVNYSILDCYYLHIVGPDNVSLTSLEYASLEELLEEWPTAQCDPKFSRTQYEVYL